MRLCGLYLITPDDADSARLIARVEHALEGTDTGQWAALQYRNKLARPGQRLAEARALAALARRHRLPFIVNDDVALALAVNADGAHLGADDGSLAEARQRLDGRILGASCHADLAAARAAVAAGADYVAFGAVFPSRTKPAAVRAPLALLGEARGLGVPRVAIGGINADNAAEAMHAGADAIAVIGAVFDSPVPAASARAIARVFIQPLSSGPS